jgi:tetratricopeptide (TPR) repeat protein
MVKIIFGVIFAGALSYVIIPLLGRKVSWVDAEDPDDERIREYELEKKINLKALKDIEFELASGKINEEDYQELKDHYLRKVSRIMGRIEDLTGEEENSVEAHHGGRGTGGSEEDEGSDENDDDLNEDDDEPDEDEGDPDEDWDEEDEDDDELDEDEDDWDDDDDDDEKILQNSDDDDEDEEWDDEEEYELRSVKGPIIVVLALALIVGVGVAFFQMGKKSALKAPAAPVASLSSPSSGQAGLEHLVRYVQENPWNVTSHLVLGEYYFGIGNTNLALAHFVSAEEVAPGDGRVLSNLGKAYRKLGNPDQAIEKFTAAADAQPESLEHLYQLGLVYGYDKGDRSRARELFEEVLSRQPEEELRITVDEELKKLATETG